jgi:hypothetical protein
MENLQIWVMVVPAVMFILLLACFIGLTYFKEEAKKLTAALANSRGIPATFKDLHDDFVYEILADVVTVDAKSYLLCRDCGTFQLYWVQMAPPQWFENERFFRVNHRFNRVERIELDLCD